MNIPENHKYNYYENVMYFEFNGKHSADYGLFLVSSTTQKVPVSKGATTNYANPMYGNGTYLLGTNRTQMQFQYNVAAARMNRELFNEMMLWLEEGAKGFLVLDENPYWGYDTVLEKVGDVTWSGPRNCGVVEFQLTFKTYGDVCAKAKVDASCDAIRVDNGTSWDIVTNGAAYTNEYHIPEILYQFQYKKDKDGNLLLDNEGKLISSNKIKFRIIHIGNKHCYFEYHADLIKLFNLDEPEVGIDVNGENKVRYSFNKVSGIENEESINFDYYSQYGFVTSGDNLFEQMTKEELAGSYVEEGSIANPAIIETVPPKKNTKPLSEIDAEENKVAVVINKDGTYALYFAVATEDVDAKGSTIIWDYDNVVSTVKDKATVVPNYIATYTEIECYAEETCEFFLYKHNNL